MLIIEINGSSHFYSFFEDDEGHKIPLGRSVLKETIIQQRIHRNEQAARSSDQTGQKHMTYLAYNYWEYRNLGGEMLK